MRRTALREFLGAAALAAGCNGDPLQNADNIDMAEPDLTQWNRCEGYDAGTGTKIISVPIDADGGFVDCASLCYQLAPPLPGQYLQLYCRDLSDDGQTRTIECNYYRMCGRRPAGLYRARVSARSLVGAHFARCAHMEAASVHAFRRLARELRAHGVRQFVAGAERSARDEVRHARAMTQLARRFGACVPRVKLRPSKIRPLVELARENAAEGCVGETFGAAVALFQARRAGDAGVRRALAAIAEDEVGHAELAWGVAAAVEKRLTRAEIKSVEAARSRAWLRLRREIGELPAVLTEVAGLPTASQARALYDAVSAKMSRSASLRP